ncbi:MAG TPA: hypothetical protein VGS96_13620 [Thermoanaerobaculia bacterium]|nr:hypothetical protein [Thermoanaerobaculia bacterium]
MLDLVVALVMWFGSHSKPSVHRVSFEKTVRPILEQRCHPCHFSGGKMYQRLPFDNPATIVKLGTKLFTRIRDEQSREAIRAFLADEDSRAAARRNERSRDKRL